MQSILDKLAEWLKELLISGILGNLSGMFDTVKWARSPGRLA